MLCHQVTENTEDGVIQDKIPTLAVINSSLPSLEQYLCTRFVSMKYRTGETCCYLMSIELSFSKKSTVMKGFFKVEKLFLTVFMNSKGFDVPLINLHNHVNL